MKKLALMTALITASVVAVPAMADNGSRPNQRIVHQDASSHKYVKYNNGNAYGKHKTKHKVKAKKYANNHYVTQHTNLKKWPVPTAPNNSPVRHRVVMGQHH